MKTGLVLEGGAMRGMFTAGVLDVLMEHNIQLDGAVGVSAGAVFGCNYKSHQIGRTIRYNTEYCTDKRQLWQPAAHRQPVQRAVLLPYRAGKTGPL
jgi:predicted patatin/cPLA2 family phospholipase